MREMVFASDMNRSYCSPVIPSVFTFPFNVVHTLSALTLMRTLRELSSGLTGSLRSLQSTCCMSIPANSLTWSL